MEKQRWEESERRRKEVRRQEKRKREKKEDAGARKGRKVAIPCVFSNDLWLRKVDSLKRRVRSQLARWGMQNCTPMWREANFESFRSKKVINTPRSEHFGSWDVEKVHAVVARKRVSKSKCTKHVSFGPLLEVDMSKKCTLLWRESAFPSQNVQNTSASDHFWKLSCRKSARRSGAKHISKSKCIQNTCLRGSDHFWKLRCRKSARCCGAKHISKSKCTKHTMFRPLLEVELSKKCTPFWREAHFQVKMYTKHMSEGIGSLLDVQMSFCVGGARHCPAWAKREGFVAVSTTNYNYNTLHYIHLHYTTLHYTRLD